METIKDEIVKIVERSAQDAASWESPVCQVCGKVGDPHRKLPDRPLPKICAVCAQTKEFDAKLPERIRMAEIPERFRSARRVDVLEELWDRLRPWVEGSEPFALLHGPTGTGKSHVAAVALQEALVHTPSGLWTSVPTMTLRLRRFGSEADTFMDELLKSPCLVLDDLGAERSTDFALEALSSLILTRWDRCARTLVTTNARPEQLHEIHPRMASRLASGIVLNVDGRDRRL